MTTPVSATTRGPRRSWMRPPMNVPTKIMPIATWNGRLACTGVSCSAELSDWKAAANVLQA